MLAIRFQRRGRKNRPFFHIVVTPKQNPVKGKFLESLGHYDPFTKEKRIDRERALYWIGQGAALSASVNNLFVSERVIEGAKMRSHATSKEESKGGEGLHAASPKEEKVPETAEAFAPIVQEKEQEKAVEEPKGEPSPKESVSEKEPSPKAKEEQKE